MKAYCDESGKHDAAKVITIVALVMSARQSKELQRRWLKEAAMAPRIPLPFHMTDCVVGSKNFAHLRPDEGARLQMQERMIRTLRGLGIQGCAASVVRRHYDVFGPQIHQSSGIRDPWFLAFEAAIQDTMLRTAAVGRNHRIAFVFDRQDEFAPKARELYAGLLSSDVSYRSRLGGLAFETRNRTAALQAADIVTYETNRFMEGHKLLGEPVRWQMEMIREFTSLNGRILNKNGMRWLADAIKAEHGL